jgi:peptide-methionine (S)-S-oxide reductase
VRVTFDPAQVSFGQLLRVFFSVAHDPTELNRQGPDHGTQYRSAVFFTDAAQKRVADAYVAQLDRAKLFHGRIATEIAPLKAFYPAEEYHQDFYKKNPVRYKFYKYSCGRAQRLEELWGKP